MMCAIEEQNNIALYIPYIQLHFKKKDNNSIIFTN